MLQLLRATLAEGLGTFFLVLVGCGAVASGADPVGVALAFAFVLAALVYALGHVSGAHFNPAITIAFASVGRFPWRRAPSYIAAQFAGAIAAAALLAATLPGAPLGVTAPAVPLAAAVAIELFASFLLALVIVSVATDARAAPGSAGLAIGLTVGACALFAGPLTGASMNPARTLGPAALAGAWEGAWIYVIAPVVGAVAAMLTYDAMRAPTASATADARAAEVAP